MFLPDGGPSIADAVTESDLAFMDFALSEARAAAAEGEVPIGAVVVCDGAVVARAHNRREIDADPTAHAELMAVREAARVLGRWRLAGCTVYVTVEPCAMCAGGLVLARVDRLVYGCDDPKAGACGSLYDIVQDPRLNHRLEVIRGVRERECAEVLRMFFESRRG
jgi:tRNA(adenine34) deaminase